MVNTLEFTKRLEILLKEYHLSAAGFAQKIAVGRATISHILSGRNKPSLDFVMKITLAFPEVDLYWLLHGKGTFPKPQNNTPPYSKTVTKTDSAPKLTTEEKTISKAVHQTFSNKAIDKIIIFYHDGSFESYTN